MREIFRKTALDQISSPDQLDQVIVITPPSFWIAMLGAGIILLTALIWSITGSIPFEVNANGIYITDSGVHVVYSTSDGIVDEVPVTDGDKIEKGDVIARLSDKTEIRADMSGYVMGLIVSPGNPVSMGSAVCRIAEENFGQPYTTTDDDPMSVILYVPFSEGKKIKTGMEVKVYPTTVNRQEYGHINAVVSEVGDYAASTEEMQNQLGDNSLVQSFRNAGPVIQIQCSLNKDNSTKSGYEWSNKKGAAVELLPGTTVNADIVTERKAPITRLVPILTDVLQVDTVQGES
jgi:multidrug efflux pump subunit AcrA (membrane-fusion protein)